MKQTIENAQSPAESGEKREITLDCEKLKIVDPAQLKRELVNAFTRASNGVRALEEVVQGTKIKRDDELFGPLVVTAQTEIANAKRLGLDVADLEAKLNQCFE